jgi:hypothetical protein
VLQIIEMQLEAEDDHKSMAWPSPEKYQVRKLVTPLVHKCKST